MTPERMKVLLYNLITYLDEEYIPEDLLEFLDYEFGISEEEYSYITEA